MMTIQCIHTCCWRACRGLLLAGLLALILGAPALAASPPPRVDAPYFDGNVRYPETAIFWFGRITPGENYSDVRVGYNDEHLYVNVATVDRRLWYQPTPDPATLESWDAATLYLDLDAGGGETPRATSYRFVGQLNFWEPRDGYQTAYRGDGAGWGASDAAFTVATGWRGHSPNSDADDRGWHITFKIPFASLGLAGPPDRGTAWRLGIIAHDRDSAGGPPLPPKTWPAALEGGRPATWGELRFGLPEPYVPEAIVPGSEGSTLIRDRHNGVTVPDGAVGGHTNCGGGAAYWTEWGNKNYAGQWYFNIQNQVDISDWPCFSKYYVRFPLDTVPAGKVVLEAKLTLHQFGGAGAGWSPPAQRSLIQAFTVPTPWDEHTLTWNSAPLAGRFVDRTWVDPTSVYLGQPGKPWTWDVTGAVAEAYAAGEPLSLVFYEADAAYHSGKYFRTSEEEEFDKEGRPTLEITWGEPRPTLDAVAWPIEVEQGDVVVYNLLVGGSGQPLTLTDRLPAGVSAPASLSPGLHFTPPDRFTWTGAPAYGTHVTLGYAVTVTAGSRLALVNDAMLTQTAQITARDAAVIFIDPLKVYLPLIPKTG